MTATADIGRITLDISEGVARIAIDRPTHLNALNNELRRQLSATVDEASTHEVGVVVLSGGGRKAFAAGADIDELIDLTPAQSLELSGAIAELHGKLESLPVPVIAAIRGWCLGGGLELALAADIRIASDTARLGLPEIKLGILPGGGGIARLVRAAGPVAARHMCLTGTIVEAKRALELGLISEMHAEADFDTRVNTLAAALAGSSRPALRAMKNALRAAGELSLAGAVQQEAQFGSELYGSPEQRTAMSEFLAARARKKTIK
jgi:enoyl-CoA hydratase/carnithine racemase